MCLTSLYSVAQLAVWKHSVVRLHERTLPVIRSMHESTYCNALPDTCTAPCDLPGAWLTLLRSTTLRFQCQRIMQSIIWPCACCSEEAQLHHGLFAGG